MIKRNHLQNFGKLVVLAMVFSFIAYVMNEKKEDPQTGHEFSRVETTLNSEQPEQDIRDSIVEYGLSLLDTPYVTAGIGKDGFDCSGYIYFVFQHFEIEVPRSTSGYEDFGSEIPIEDVKKGDLLLFLSPTRNALGHIGIVTHADGKESDFIHATSGEEMSVVITNLSDEGYTRRFVKAVRVL